MANLPPSAPDVSPPPSNVPTDSQPSGWLLSAALRDLWRRFREGWRQSPRGAWGRYLVTLLLGLVLCAALVIGLVRLGQALVERHGLQAWDERNLLLIEKGPINFQNAILLESFGNLAYLIPLTLACVVVATRRGRPLVAVSFLAAYVLTRPLVILGWKMWERSRPDLIAGGLAAPKLGTFPSGHVALSIGVYGLLAYLWARHSPSRAERALAWLLAAAIVVVTGWARLRLGTHWPSDVLAGFVVGVAWLGVVIFALRRAERAGGR